MANATLIVPSNAEAQIMGRGYIAVQVSARKVKLMNADGTLGPERVYKQSDRVESMTFGQLVDFVLTPLAEFSYKNGIVTMNEAGFRASLKWARKCGCGDCVHCRALEYAQDNNHPLAK